MFHSVLLFGYLCQPISLTSHTLSTCIKSVLPLLTAARCLTLITRRHGLVSALDQSKYNISTGDLDRMTTTHDDDESMTR